jgi:hypothetical protein
MAIAGLSAFLNVPKFGAHAPVERSDIKINQTLDDVTKAVNSLTVDSSTTTPNRMTVSRLGEDRDYPTAKGLTHYTVGSSEEFRFISQRPRFEFIGKPNRLEVKAYPEYTRLHHTIALPIENEERQQRAVSANDVITIGQPDGEYARLQYISQQTNKVKALPNMTTSVRSGDSAIQVRHADGATETLKLNDEFKLRNGDHLLWESGDKQQKADIAFYDKQVKDQLGLTPGSTKDIVRLTRNIAGGKTRALANGDWITVDELHAPKSGKLNPFVIKIGGAALTE